MSSREVTPTLLRSFMVIRESKRRNRIDRYRKDTATLLRVRNLGNDQGWTAQQISLVMHLGGIYGVVAPPESHLFQSNALSQISVYARWSDLILQEITRRARRDRIDHPLPLPPRRSS